MTEAKYRPPAELTPVEQAVAESRGEWRRERKVEPLDPRVGIGPETREQIGRLPTRRREQQDSRGYLRGALRRHRERA